MDPILGRTVRGRVRRSGNGRALDRPTVVLPILCKSLNIRDPHITKSSSFAHFVQYFALGNSNLAAESLGLHWHARNCGGVRSYAMRVRRPNVVRAGQAKSPVKVYSDESRSFPLTGDQFLWRSGGPMQERGFRVTRGLLGNLAHIP